MIAKCRWRGSVNIAKARSSQHPARCSENDFPVRVVQIEIGIADRDLRQDRTKLFLALRLHDNYMLFIEFRPNDLASPHVVRLTDDPPPDLDLTDRVWRGLNYTHSKDDLP
jgi:hypothetical protein